MRPPPVRFMSTKRLDTLALHAGQEAPDPATGARAVPIYQTTSFVFKSTEHAANLFRPERVREHLHPNNEPDHRCLREEGRRHRRRLAALAVGSGQAAEALALLAITRLGDEIVSANNLYGGTYQLFHYTLPKLGRQVKFVDSTKPELFKYAITHEDSGHIRRDDRQPQARRTRTLNASQR